MPSLVVFDRTGQGSAFGCFKTELDKTTESTIPKIKPCNLANIVLQPKAIGTGDIIGFHFMKKPSRWVSYLCFIIIAAHVWSAKLIAFLALYLFLFIVAYAVFTFVFTHYYRRLLVLGTENTYYSMMTTSSQDWNWHFFLPFIC